MSAPAGSFLTFGLGPIAGGASDPAGAILAAGPHAPYLAALARRLKDAMALLASEGPEAVLAHALFEARAAGEEQDPEIAMARLRNAKASAHLAVAAADLSGLWALDTVVGALSRFADAATEAALAQAIRVGRAAGRLDGKGAEGPMPGLFALAMGKMGAGELNYSSDIDLILLFDAERAPLTPARAKDDLTRVARDLVRILESRTVDGYVFRVDLRLRPDPNSTAPVVSTRFAHDYYQSVGQNWERMAHIKARPCAGDLEAAGSYLILLEPYVWRRHLDYWAIADIHSIKRQIHAEKGHAALAAREFDVKLGRGGVREIEFFVQVQQLILGGRSPDLRAPGTKAALAAMAERGTIARDVFAGLAACYDFLRALEHRIQMRNDEQTHLLPDNDLVRTDLRALCGYAREEAFEADIGSVRAFVHGVYSDLFAREERLSGEAGNLVFTGVDDDPDTVATLARMGFANPSRVIRIFQDWHRGGIPATRSPRGRQLLTTLGPRLLETLAAGGEPDAALDRFVDFFSRLKGGVQTMSLMLAEPRLTEDILQTMAFAPQLARDLAQRPRLLDVMLDARFQRSVGEDQPGEREDMLRVLIGSTAGFEEQLNAARRFHREERFRIGYQLLRGRIRAVEAGEAYADLADACVRVLANAAAQEVLQRFGGDIGPWAICALGKFGGRELTATSDLDLMLVFEPATPESGALAARFVQRLVAALSAPTEEGELYHVDMQLRPSGKAGPVAVQITSFESYYADSAWTWEFMALTRMRPMAGNPALCARIETATAAAIARKSRDPALTHDVLDMRRRLARERPAASFWDVKLAPGGIVDIEFIVQHGLLQAGAEAGHPRTPATIEGIGWLEQAGRLTAEEARMLRVSLSFQLDLQQAQRIACGDRFDPDGLSHGLRSWLSQLLGAPDFDALTSRLQTLQADVGRVQEARLGKLSTD